MHLYLGLSKALGANDSSSERNSQLGSKIHQSGKGSTGRLEQGMDLGLGRLKRQTKTNTPTHSPCLPEADILLDTVPITT
jgi:hypothetical protein